MPYRFALIVFASIIMAACSAAPEPTATPAPVPTDAPQVTQAPVATDALLNIVGVTLPPPGTAVLPPVTDDPNPNTLFSSVELIRTGGPANSTLSITVSGEGTLTRDDADGTHALSQQAVDRLDALLDQARFYEIEGVFTANSAQPDIYRYSLTVSGPGGSRTISADDNLTPPELRTLFEAVLALGTGAPGDLEATAEMTPDAAA